MQGDWMDVSLHLLVWKRPHERRRQEREKLDAQIKYLQDTHSLQAVDEGGVVINV
jgi:hypothetical protein